MSKNFPRGKTFPFLFLAIHMIVIAGNSCKNSKTQQKSTQKNPAVTNPQKHINLVQKYQEAALNGDLGMVRQIVDNGMDADVPSPDGRTALMLAAYNGHTDIIKYLLSKGANVNTLDNAGRSALIYAASGPFPETVKVLLDHKADPDIIAKGDGWTALMFAAAEGQLEVVKVLLAHGANARIKEKDGDDAESFARKNGHTEVADYLHKYAKKK